MAAEESKPRQLELLDYVRIISKRKWFILIVTAVAALMGLLYALSSEKKWEATSLVLIRQQPEGFFWVSGETANILPNVAMETYARMVRSTQVAEEAAERLENLPSELSVLATPNDIRNTLEVSVIQPDLLRIDATSPDERNAQLYANYVASSFVSVNTEDRQRESRLAREFLEEQVETTREELQGVIDEMAQLARRSGFADIKTEVQAAVTNLQEYENRRRQAKAEVRAAEARVAELEEVAHTESDVIVRQTPVPNPDYRAIQQSLTEAKLELERLRSQYTDGHPRVIDAEALVQQLSRALRSTPELVEQSAVSDNPAKTGINQELKAARVALEEARARLSTIEGELAGLRDRVRELPDDQQQWQALMDRADTLRNAYQQLHEELRQARLAEKIKQGNARVVDTASSARPIQASYGRSLLFSTALGLFLGLALGILLEALDDTIYSVEDLRRVTDLYLLGVIPLRTDEAGPLVTVTAPKSPPAEAYRTLRSNIRFSLFDEDATTFLVTSAGTGEGKSVTAANLAVAYAQSGESVIVVDTDLRRPIMHRLFERDNDVGLTNVLVGDMEIEEALLPTEIPGLRLMPSGPLPPNPAELLESGQMTELIGELRGRADIVIFDSPPAIMLTDAGILSAKVDRTVLVAESGQVTERAVRDMERLFEHARADVLGTVLNKLRVTGGDYYYYYYYYYDYADRPTRGNDHQDNGLNGSLNGNGADLRPPNHATAPSPEEADENTGMLDFNVDAPDQQPDDDQSPPEDA